MPPVRQADARTPLPLSRIRADWIEERILYEDQDLLVLNKPSGLAVHGGSGISLGAIELLRAVRGPREHLELVHRLDRDTSGCLLVAKTGQCAACSACAVPGWQHRQTLSRPADRPLAGPGAHAWMRRSSPMSAAGGERHVRVDAAGKAALTHFVPLERFAEAALVEVHLTTGRTHQIRVHAASIGHPVAGDERYGAADDPAVAKYGLKRLFLHARSLAFRVPTMAR